MRNLLLGFVFGIFVTSMLAGKSSKAQVQSPQSVKPPTRLYSVVGTGWQTCSDWKATTPSFNTGYIIGHDEAMIQLTQLLRSNPSAADVMQSFDVPAGIKYGDESKSVDKFCEDYRNVRMPLVNALGIVLLDIAGKPSIDDKTLRILRCQAAAGNDENKIRDCESQP